jgi:hypothetical protein
MGARTWLLPTLHAAIGVIVALVLPAWSWGGGNGTFAWTMFSKSETFRIGVLLTDRDGTRTRVPPAALAPHATPWVAHYLHRAGEWLHSPVGITFRTSLQGVAQLGCALPEVAEVVVTLQERRDLDAPIRATEARVLCPAR